MPSAGDIRAGGAFVELTTSDAALVRGLRQAQRRLRAFSRSVTDIGQKLARTAGVVAAPLALSIKAASDMEEVMNKFNVVFGENSKEVKAWGDNFSKQVGRSKRQVAEFLAGTQDLFVPLGFDSGTAEGLSKQLTGLAIDLASFNNKADADVMRDLQAALTGSSEVMKKYGVIVNETAVKQELLNQGLDPKAANEQQKVMARLNIIMRGTTAAQGDAVRSAGSFANQMKRLRGRLEDAGAAIGNALLPLVTQFVEKAVGVVKRMAEWAQANKQTIIQIAKITAIVGTAGVALIALGKVLGAIATTIGVTASAVKALIATLTFLAAHPVVAVIGVITAGVIALSAALQSASKHTAQLSDRMAEQLARGDKQRRTTQLQLKRLEQLTEKQRLTNAEMDEAAGLIETLEKAYGDLGVSVDRTTGQINGLADAQGRVNIAMRNAAALELKAALSEVDRNIAELKEELKSFFESFTTKNPFKLAFRFDKLSFGEGDRKLVADLEKRIKEFADKRRALQIRIDALQAGDKEALVGPKPKQDEQANLERKIAGADADALNRKKRLAETEQELARLAEDAARRRRSAVENEINDIRKLAAEREKLIKLLIEEERNNPNGASVLGLEKLGVQLRQVRGQRDTDIATVREREAKRQKEGQDRQRKQRIDAEKRVQQDIARLQIEATKKGLARQLALLDLERKQALEEAKAAGIDPALIKKQFDLRKGVLEGADAADQQSQVSARGTFNGAAIQALLTGGGDAANERTAKAAEKMDLNLREIKHLVDQLIFNGAFSFS